MALRFKGLFAQTHAFDSTAVITAGRTLTPVTSYEFVCHPREPNAALVTRRSDKMGESQVCVNSRCDNTPEITGAAFHGPT